MLSVTLLLTLSGFLQGVRSLTTPTRTHIRPRKVQGVAAPAIPTSTLISDFKKGNISAQWAEGHPKVWGQEAKHYIIPGPLGSIDYDAIVSDDQKFLITANSTLTSIIHLDTDTVVATFAPKYWGYAHEMAIAAAPGGQYDLLQTASNYSNNDKLIQLRLSQNGVPIGEIGERSGVFPPFDSTPFSRNKRRVLAVEGRTPPFVRIYDLDNANSTGLTLSGHTDAVMSATFSPDDKYITTTAWDGYVKVWDATTGELVHNFGPSGGQNWLALYTQNGTSILYTVGSPVAHVFVQPLTNLGNGTASPIDIGSFYDWVRGASWSPDGEYLALGGYGQITIRKTSDLTVVQTWQTEEGRRGNEIRDLTWLDGGKKIAYHNGPSLELYDFEKNLKYRWGPDDLDHYASYYLGVFVVRSKGWIGSLDGDQKVRFWPYPA